MNIFIFYTNVIDHVAVKSISTSLDMIGGIKRWTIDTGDCDKVLRVQGEADVPLKIVNALQKLGYTCCQQIPHI